MADQPPAKASAGGLAFAWAVHAFTASGAALAFFALLAVDQGDYRLALMWLVAALAIDGIDGSFARAAKVKVRASRIDGDTLDLIIDYLTYVFVPTALIVRAGLVPEALAPWLAALILISALYNFTRRDLKTEDNYFRGFPALWNVVAFYLLVLTPSPMVGAGVVILFAFLTIAPIHFLHPFRVTDYGLWSPFIAIAWVTATVALLWPGWSEPVRTGWAALSLATAALILLLGLWRSYRGPKPVKAAA